MKRLISLLAAATAIVMLALPGLAQSTSFTWELDCSGAATSPGVGTGVTGYWLNNGVQISLIPFTTQPDGTATCAVPPFSGSGVIPTGVNGIALTLGLDESPGCEASASVTKSFDPSNPKISISVNVSAPTKSYYYPYPQCPKAGFHFSLKT